ncbi:amidohydrolase family protein [Achromobacter xylosoxidans]
MSGLVVAPGFIDSHTHDDNYLLRRRDMTPKISQGVTTVVTGNCGISLAPLAHPAPPAPLDLLDEGGSYKFTRFADYLDALRATPAAVNAACMVGHSTLRAAVMPDLHRPATPAEIDAMRALAEEAMASGAIGVSTGTFYPPAAHATTEEIIEVCRALATHGGIYATHMRDEGEHIVPALEETFRIVPELDVPVVISHHKLAGQPNFGLHGNAGADRARHGRAGRVAGRLSLRGRLNHAQERPRAAGWPRDHHLVQALPRTDRARAGRGGGRARQVQVRRGRRTAARRRHLFHDGRGRRAAHPVLPAHHDWLRRPAA